MLYVCFTSALFAELRAVMCVRGFAEQHVRVRTADGRQAQPHVLRVLRRRGTDRQGSNSVILLSAV